MLEMFEKKQQTKRQKKSIREKVVIAFTRITQEKCQNKRATNISKLITANTALKKSIISKAWQVVHSLYKF